MKVVTIFVVFCVIQNSIAISGGTPPQPPSGGNGNVNCQGGSVQCCNSIQQSTSNPVLSLLTSLLGLNLSGIAQSLGINCIPIAVIGASGTSCSSQTACCTGNTFNGLITVGCTPFNLGLG